MSKGFAKQSLILLANIGDLMEFVFRAPFRSMKKYRRSSKNKSRFWNLVILPLFCVTGAISYSYSLFSSPWKSLKRISSAKRRDMFLAIPALVAMISTGYVIITVTSSGDAIESRYRAKIREALADKDFEKANIYLIRIINGNNDPSRDDLFSFAMTLSQTGNVDRATAILNELAPDDQSGFSQAHTVKALNIYSLIRESATPEMLAKMKWHLENSHDRNSQEVNQAWALYYMAVQQPEKAVSHMEQAAEINPKLLLTAADIYKSSNNSLGAKRTLRRAEEFFERSLSKNPMDADARIWLAKTFVKLDEIKRAEKILLGGDQIHSTPKLKRAIAEFYVMWHDLSVLEGANFQLQLGSLQNAMEFDINYAPIYERLIRQYRRSDGQTNAVSIKSMLESAIANGQSTALAHFAIGNMYWIQGENDKAEWHISQAYRIDNRLAAVGNNLAWLLAHKEEPELEQALKLARAVVKQDSDKSSFRDTLATVLMKRGELEEALVEFEKILPQIVNTKPVHEKISYIYEKLGNEDLAALHHQLAVQLDHSE